MMPLHFSRSSVLLAPIMLLVSAMAAGSVLAADDMPKHLRGTITAVSDAGFTVESKDGASHKVEMGSDARVAGVVPSSLDQIEEGTFIGTANVENGDSARALEVVIFPESMKGTGLGDYPWDLSPQGQSSTDDGKMSGGSAMTNGTVSESSEGSDKMTGGSAMTNGTVSESSGSSDKMNGGSTMTNGTVSQSSGSGEMTLKVDYGKGSKQIVVPQDVPVVAVQKASMDDIKEGAAVFVAGDMSQSPIKAKTVIVGIDGTAPPM